MALDMTKPYKGQITDWFKVACGDSGLGFYIRGRCMNHPQFGESPWFHTSYVVKHEGNEVETLNSRYTLGTSYVETRSKEEIEQVRKKAQEAAKFLVNSGAV